MTKGAKKTPRRRKSAAGAKKKNEREFSILGFVDLALSKANIVTPKSKKRNMTIPEVLKLLQVKKELTEKIPAKVTVQWIDNWKETSDET